MSWSLAAVVGVAVGGLAVVVIVVGLICLYLFRWKGLSNKASETASSDPSTLVEWHGAGEVSSSCGAPPDHHGARKFSLGELEQASNEFSENNLVGVGSFGLVYKGLLLDGTLVAIKRRRRAPRPEFVEEIILMNQVHHLSAIRHRNLVTLIGYSQEGGLQMLVFEYLPNRSIRGHLYESGTNQTTKLEFKQRLSVAIGAAKGLAHLHSLSPPLIHRNFKTSNVLVDENFIAKVADAGLIQLLERMDGAGSSQASVNDIFQDPQVEQMGVQPSESSDAYSFGVFLLELITGREVESLMVQAPSETLTKVVEAHLRSETFIDGRLGNSYTYEGMKEFVVLTLRCLSSAGRRPKMEHVVRELDRILETEMTLTTVMGDGTAIVTLGSQLFTS
ncbi:putative leucine-rich repeat receptor-like protein kinase [Platanthera zijinensis]|uniref:non-specific serine/threonine protein kinase n=1 Tax=Platanthera zijinensis TaxID=2320716 RepID=A0AAP0B4Y9_9ASPA